MNMNWLTANLIWLVLPFWIVALPYFKCNSRHTLHALQKRMTFCLHKLGLGKNITYVENVFGSCSNAKQQKYEKTIMIFRHFYWWWIGFRIPRVWVRLCWLISGLGSTGLKLLQFFRSKLIGFPKILQVQVGFSSLRGFEIKIGHYPPIFEFRFWVF